MKPLSSFLFRNRYTLTCSAVILLASILRCYNLYNRIGIGGDDARDIMVAHEALIRHHLPLVGPFSSAGPFVTGPLYFWFLMISIILLPNVILAPWILLACSSVLAVIIMMWIGFLLQGKRLAVLLGVLAASCPLWITWSTTLTNPSFIIPTAASVLLFSILLFKKQKNIYALGLGISIGLALNMHYQALNLGIFLFTPLLITNLSWRKKIVALFIIFLAILFTLLPFLLWDSQQGFANFRNVLDYFLIGQYRVYVPNNWKIFLFQAVPGLWSAVIGAYIFISLGILVLVGVYILRIFINREKKMSIIKILAVYFALSLVVVRYYHGERGNNYLLYLSPLLLLFSALALDYFFYTLVSRYIKKKYFANISIALIVGLIIVANVFSLRITITYPTSQFNLVKKTADIIEADYPGKKFQLYDYKLRTSDISQGISAILAADGKESTDGIALGIICSDCYKHKKVPLTTILNASIFPLTQKNTMNNVWGKLDQSDVYDNLVVWLENHNLHSSFNLQKFILERI